MIEESGGDTYTDSLNNCVKCALQEIRSLSQIRFRDHWRWYDGTKIDPEAKIAPNSISLGSKRGGEFPCNGVRDKL